jgi:predicted metalloprotease with PDZ domain
VTIEQVLGRLKPGAQVPIRFVRRGGERVDQTITLEEDPRIEIVPIESAGGALSPDQRRFREAWLGAQ